MVAHHDWRHRRVIALVKIGNGLVPALFSGFRIERHQIIVWRLEEEPVVIHAHPSVVDVRGSLCSPPVMPNYASRAGIHGPRVIRRGHVEDAVHLQYDADYASAIKSTDGNSLICFPTVNRGDVASSATPRVAEWIMSAPRERKIFHISFVDLRECAEPAARIISRINGPRVSRWFQKRCRVESLRRESHGSQHCREN